MTHKIVIVDDDHVSMLYYIQALSLEGYDVIQLYSATSFAQFLDSHEGDDVDLFVIDVMMPPGEVYKRKETSCGLYTGLLIARDLRSAGHEAPVILLSQANIKEIQKQAEGMAAKLDECIFLLKHDTTPDILTEIVNRYFREAKLKSEKKGIVKRLFGSLLIQPNIAGVGIDVKKLKE
jgi:CheY-like chemotaxis protein